MSRKIGPVVVVGITTVVVLALFALTLGAFQRSRAAKIEEISTAATARVPGPRVEALVALATDATAEIGLRNRAVWALGELRDEAARPALQSLVSGGECDHERQVCQREVDKALRKLDGERTLASAVRRAVMRWTSSG